MATGSHGKQQGLSLVGEVSRLAAVAGPSVYQYMSSQLKGHPVAGQS
jgi:hypothetical protein